MLIMPGSTSRGAATLNTAGGVYLGWLKYNFDYTDFAVMDVNNTLDLYTLPVGGIIHDVKIKHSTAFSGGALSAYTIEIGVVGNYSKYAAAFDVFQAVSGTAFQFTTVQHTESHTATSAVKVTARSVGANLDVATAGVVDLWLLISTAV